MMRFGSYFYWRNVLTKVDVRLVISGGDMLTNANIQAVFFRQNRGKISMRLFKKM